MSEQIFKVGQKVKVNSVILGTRNCYNGCTAVIKEVDGNAIRVFLDGYNHSNGFWVFPNGNNILEVEILEDVQAI